MVFRFQVMICELKFIFTVVQIFLTVIQQRARTERLPKAAGGEEGEAAQGYRGRGSRGSPRLQGVRKERLLKAAGGEDAEAPQGFGR